MKGKHILQFIFLAILIIPLSIVKADVFDNATFTINSNNTGKLSDDYIIIELSGNNEITNVENYRAIVTDSTMSTGSNFSNVTVLMQEKGSATISSINGSKKKFKINCENLTDTNMTSLEKDNISIYVNMFIKDGSGKYNISTENNVSVNTVSAVQRLRDIKVTIDKKNTLTTTDDVVTISDAYTYGYRVGLKVVLTNDAGDKGNPSDGKELTVSGSSGTSFTFDNSYYSNLAKDNEELYLFIYAGEKLVTPGIKIDGLLGADVFKNAGVEHVRNSSTSQTDTSIKITNVESYDTKRYYAVFSKEVDTRALGTAEYQTSVIVTPYCIGGSQLGQVAVGSNYYFELKDRKCYLQRAQEKGDTYVTFYTYVRRTICEYKIENDAVVEDCPPAIGGTSGRKKITNSIKINRPADLALSKRVDMKITPTGYLFYMNNLSNQNATDRETFSSSDSTLIRTANYKIGIVDDKSILRNLRDTKSGAYEALLEYAKKGTAAKTGNLKIYPNKTVADEKGLVEEALYSKSDLSDGGYYYLYINYDGKDNSGNDFYYSFDDIQIFSANKTSSGEIELIAKDNIKWSSDLGDEPGTSGGGSSGGGSSGEVTPKKNPKTGIATYSLLTLSIAAIVVIIYIKTKKVTKFPEGSK